MSGEMDSREIKKRKQKASIAWGIIGMIFALWLGCFMFEIFPAGSPYRFASIGTVIIMGICSFVLFLSTLINYGF